MFRRFMKVRLAVGATAAVGALALAVGAYAYFTSNGTGNSSATAGMSSNYGVTVVPTGSPSLYPTLTTDSNFSGLIQPYTGVVTNTSTGHQQVSLLTAKIESVSQASTAVGSCTTGDFSLYSPSGGWSVATGGQSATAGSGTSATTLPDTTPQTLPYDMAGGAKLDYSDIAVYLVDNPSASQDGCQGAKVNVSVTAS